MSDQPDATPWELLNKNGKLDRLMYVMGLLITSLSHELGDDEVARLLGRLHGVDAAKLLELVAQFGPEEPAS